MISREQLHRLDKENKLQVVILALSMVKRKRLLMFVTLISRFNLESTWVARLNGSRQIIYACSRNHTRLRNSSSHVWTKRFRFRKRGIFLRSHSMSRREPYLVLLISITIK